MLSSFPSGFGVVPKSRVTFVIRAFFFFAISPVTIIRSSDGSLVWSNQSPGLEKPTPPYLPPCETWLRMKSPSSSLPLDLFRFLRRPLLKSFPLAAGLSGASAALFNRAVAWANGTFLCSWSGNGRFPSLSRPGQGSSLFFIIHGVDASKDGSLILSVPPFLEKEMF